MAAFSPLSPPTDFSMTETLSQLRTLLNTSLDVLEAELVNNSLPPFSFAPVAHPLDDPAALAPFKLYEARRAAVGALGMITNLIRPSWQSTGLE